MPDGPSQLDSERALAPVVSITASLPGVIALGVGSTYLVGTVIRAGQLHHAGIPASSALSLYSPTELLVEGVDFSLGLGLLILATLALIGAMAALSPRPKPPLIVVRRKQDDSNAPKALAGVLLGCIAGLLLAISPLPYLFLGALAAMLVAAGFTWYAHRRRTPSKGASLPRRIAFPAVFIVLLASLLAQTYQYPPPFPQAELKLLSGTVMTGPLADHETDSYSLVIHRRLLVFPASRVASVAESFGTAKVGHSLAYWVARLVGIQTGL